MAVTVSDVEAILCRSIDPNTGKDFVAGGAVRAVRVEAGVIRVDIELAYPGRSQFELIGAQIRAALAERADSGTPIEVNVSSRIVAHGVQRGVKLIPGVKNVIAVASGKGGVGKSTTAVNLACALAMEGASVGLLDADIYGPSQPMMLGISGRPESVEENTMEPMLGHGIQANSIGFLVDMDAPMVWRGPMVTQALEQLIRQTRWRDLDYLVVDLPPGTGDIQLTLAQRVPVTGAVIVTTPQDIALLDARKGLRMFQKVNIPILGIVENMSTHVCSNCGHAEPIFGSGGAERMSADYQVELLGQLPLDIRIREQTDAGTPPVLAEPDSPAAQTYRRIARRVAVKIGELQKDLSSKFPNIVIKNT
jgi:ATP-binding protein involved in chromosome partitioning